MNEESFVKVPQSTIVLLHGQVGNMRHRLSRCRILVEANQIEAADAMLVDIVLELAYLEQYLPPHNLKLPF